MERFSQKLKLFLAGDLFFGRKKMDLFSEIHFLMLGAGNETRTRDPDLGKVVLYQLSYSRVLVRRIL